MNMKMGALTGRRLLGGALVLITASVLTSPTAPAGQLQDGSIAAALAGINSLVHGPMRTYLGSPVLCARLAGRPPAPSGGGCTVRLQPDARDPQSPALSGALEFVATEPQRAQALLALLERLAAPNLRDRLAPLQKVALQMTLWELHEGLVKLRKAITPPYWNVVDPLILTCRRALGNALLSENEITGLPPTLDLLAKVAADPEVSASLDRLRDPNGGFLEIANPTILHTEITDGRLITRVFLALDPRSVDPLTHALMQAGDVRSIRVGRKPGGDYTRPHARVARPDPAMENRATTLPLRFAGVRGILLLFLAVLDEHWMPRPTPIVAAWQDYTMTRRAPNPPDKGRFEPGYGDHVRFRSIELRRLDGSATPRWDYVTVPPERPEPVGLLPRASTSDGARATTHRDNCVGCHFDGIAALDTRLPEWFDFEPPLSAAVPLPVQEWWQHLADSERER